MFRAITRTVLFDHTAASSSMNRVDDASDADARSPARAPLTVTSSNEVAPGAKLGRSQDTSAANTRCPESDNRCLPFGTAGVGGSLHRRRDRVLAFRRDQSEWASARSVSRDCAAP